MTAQRERLRLISLAATVAALAGTAVLAYAADVLRPLELGSVDARYSVRGERPPPRDVVVVAVDARSLRELRMQWPFPRSLHARLIDRLRGAAARVIAYDVQFSQPSPPGREAEDNALIEAVARADGRVVLGTTEVSSAGEANVLGAGGILGRIGARAGNSNFPLDRDGVIRRMAHSIDGLRSFPIVVRDLARGGRLPADALGPDGRAPIDFAGDERTFRTVSFSRAVRGAEPARTFAGRIVVVGASAPSLQDVHATATSPAMSGAEVQANAIDTAQRGFPLRPLPGWLAVATIVLLGALPALLAARLRLTLVALGSLAAAIVWTVGAQLAFDSGTIVPLTYPLLALALATVGALGVHALFAGLERARVRESFARFVDPRVVHQALERAEGARLGAELVEATVLFNDIRGFTRYSETRTPGETFEVLNRYLTLMSDAVLDNGGAIGGYRGDGLIAVFGAPLEQPDHADRALAAAADMVKKLADFNRRLADEGLAEGFRIGVGIDSGPIAAGNVGSERRLEFTAIGDAANVAARVEATTKDTPFQVLLTDATRSLLRRQRGDLVEVGEVAIRGRAGTVRLWALAGSDDSVRRTSAGEVAGSRGQI